jgi:hypothetical protein
MRFLKPALSVLIVATSAQVATGCSGAGPALNPSGASAGAPPAMTTPLEKPVRGTLLRNTPASTVRWQFSLVPSPLPSRDPHPSWMRLRQVVDGHTSKDILWVTNFGFPVPINEYSLPNRNNNGPLCETPGAYGVNSMGVDAKGNLWVPSTGSSGTPGQMYVQEYNCSGSFGSSISDVNGQPADVAFDSHGNFYVGNVIDYWWTNLGCCYLVSGTVNIYNPGGVEIGRLSDPSFFSPHPPGFDLWNSLVGVAVDAHDNCYVSHQDDTGGGEVVEFPACKSAKQGKILAGPHPWEPGKPQFDAAGNLLITDWATGGFGDYRSWYASVYAPPYNGPPTKTFPMYGQALACPISTDQTLIYCGDFDTGTIDVYSYKTGKYLYSFNNGLQIYGVLGIALTPAGSR